MKRLVVVVLVTMLFQNAFSGIKDYISSGYKAGVWSEDLTAARKQAASHGPGFYIMVFAKSSGCGFCEGAADSIWNQKAFKSWAGENDIPLVYANCTIMNGAAQACADLYFNGAASLPVFFVIDGKNGGKDRLGWDTMRSSTREGQTPEGDVKRGGIGVFVGGLSPDVPKQMLQFYLNRADDSPVATRNDKNYYNPTATEIVPNEKTSTKVGDLTVNGLWNGWGVNTLTAKPYYSSGTSLTCREDDRQDWYAFKAKTAGETYVVRLPTLTDKSGLGYMGFYTTLKKAQAAAKSFSAAKSNAAAWYKMTDMAAGDVALVTAPEANTTYYLCFTRRETKKDTEEITLKYTFTMQQSNQNQNPDFEPVLPEGGYVFDEYDTNAVDLATAPDVITNVIQLTVAKGNDDVAATAKIALADGTASCGVDFVEKSVSVSFAKSDKKKTVPVTLISKKGVWRGTRDFTWSITDGAKKGVEPVKVTILDVDPAQDPGDPADDDRKAPGFVPGELKVGSVVTNRLNGIAGAYCDTNDIFRLTEFSANKYVRVRLKGLVWENCDKLSLSFDGIKKDGGLPKDDASVEISPGRPADEIDLTMSWYEAREAYFSVSRPSGSGSEPVCAVYEISVTLVDPPVVRFAGDQTEFVYDSPTADSNVVFRVTGDAIYENVPPRWRTVEKTATNGLDYVAVGVNGGDLRLGEAETEAFADVTLKDAGKWRPERTFEIELLPDAEKTYLMGEPRVLTVTLRGDPCEKKAPATLSIGSTGFAATDLRNVSHTNVEDVVYFDGIEAGRNYVLGAEDVLVKPAGTYVNVTVSTNNAGRWVKYGDWNLADLADVEKMPLLTFGESGKVMVSVSRASDKAVAAEYKLKMAEWQPTTISFARSAWTNAQNEARVLSYEIVRTGETSFPANVRVTLTPGTARADVDVVPFTDRVVTFGVNEATARVVVTNLMFATPGIWKGERTFGLSLKVEDEKYSAGEFAETEVVLVDPVPEYEPGDTAGESIAAPVSTNGLGLSGIPVTRTLNGADEQDFFCFTNAVAGKTYRFELKVFAESTRNVKTAALHIISGDLSGTNTVDFAKFPSSGYDYVAEADGNIYVWLSRTSQGDGEPTSLRYELTAREWPWPTFGFVRTEIVTNNAAGAAVTLTIRRTENLQETNSVAVRLVALTNTTTSGTSPLKIGDSQVFTFLPNLDPNRTEDVTNLVLTLKAGRPGYWTGNWSFRAELLTNGVDKVRTNDRTNCLVRVMDVTAERDYHDFCGDDSWKTLVTNHAMQVRTGTIGGLTLNGSDSQDWFRFTGIEADATYLFTFETNRAENVKGLGMTFWQFDGDKPVELSPISDGLVRSLSAGDLLVLIARDDTDRHWEGKPVSLAYELSFRQITAWVYITPAETSVSEAADGVYLNVVAGSDSALSLPIRVTVYPETQDGDKATAPQDFSDRPISLEWPEGMTGEGVRQIKVPLTNYDNLWESSEETFHVRLEVESGAEGVHRPEDGMSTNTLVRIVERDPGDYGKVSLAGVGTPIAKVTSSTVSPAVEGGKVTVRLTRKGGVAGSVVSTWTWVDDKNKQIPGSKTVTLTNFAEGIKGDSDVEIPVPVRTGFQKSQTWTLKWSLASGCKATASGLSSVKFKVSDSTYGGKVAAYSSGDVTKPAFKASGTDWYLGSDGSLRSSNPAAGKSLSTTVAVTGPGTLKFHAAFEDGTDCSLKVSGGDATVTVKADGDYAVHFGAGKKTLKFTFSRPSKKGVDTAAVAISGIEFVPDVGFRTIGTFTGPVTVDGVPGLATVTVAGSGKTSGKFQCADRTWTFSSKTGWDTKTWTMTVSAKSGSAKVEGLVFGIDPSTGVMTNGVSPECDWSVSSMLVRNAWADAPALSETIDRLSPYVGSYAVLLPGDEDCGHGYLSLTVSDSGAVKAVGYLADGRSVSLSGALALDAGGHAVTYLYTSPSAYNKGWFAVQVAFGEEKGVRVLSTAACDPLDALEYNWVSNASAGFCREVGVCGGECAAQLTDVDVASDAALSALTLSVKGEACPVQAFGGSVDDCAGICFGDDGEVRIRETGDSRLLTATVTASTGVVVGKVRIRFANAAGEVVTTKSYSYRGIMTPNVPGGSAGVAGGGFVSVDGRSYRVDFRGAADE